MSETNPRKKTRNYYTLLPAVATGFYNWPSAHFSLVSLGKPPRASRQASAGTRSRNSFTRNSSCKVRSIVTLTDSATLPKSLSHTKPWIVNQHIRVLGLTWGLFLSNIDAIGPIDLILASTFEDILVTVSYLLAPTQTPKFICTYQELSSDWSIEHLLAKWDLECQVHNIANLGARAGLDIHAVDRAVLVSIY
ncbi:hypothetical protein NQ317_002979 [Molorchus minor]|uniref:Uncharacterized protein n=1 Tax=Molorchus minor TaxID=1323400 RepID=A0ABQ9J6L2_9CUCU|nr:hypothetical protein NQ317_002979 [Molorchus minor]